MALTYDQSAALMSDMAFRGRVKVSCLKFASSIMIEPGTTAAHNTRVRWAQQAQANPDGTAAIVQPPVVMDPAIQTDGSAITDLALQAAVEGVVNSGF